MEDQEKGETSKQLPTNTGETTVEDAPPTFPEEEKNQPSSSLLNPGPSSSLERGTGAHQQTTSAAGVQDPQQKNKTAHCGACGEMLEDTEEELKNHNCAKPKCKYCDTPVIFKDYSDFAQHSESAHKDKEVFDCPYCIAKVYLRVPDTKMNLKTHENFRDVIDEKTKLCSKGTSYLKCDECSGETVVFKLYDDFETHKIQYHPYPKYLRKRQCGICQEKCELPNVLVDHAVNEHDTESVIKCPYCGIFFEILRSKLPKHVKEHREEREQQLEKGQIKIYRCLDCTKDFASEIFLKDHGEKIHNKKILFSCSQCTKEFPYSIYLEEHKKEEHKEEKHLPPLSPKMARKRPDTDKDKDEDKGKGVKKPRSNVGRLQK